MKYIFLLLIFILGIMFLFLKKNKFENKDITIPERETDFMKEWQKKLDEAKLNEKLYNQTDEKEKYDLIYYFTYKFIKNNSIEELPKALKVLYMIDILEAQVNNGGFHQLFTNSSGQYISDILKSLDYIDANDTKLLLEKAIEIMQSHGENPEHLNKQLQKFKRNKIYQVSETITNEEMYNQLSLIDGDFFKSTEPLRKLTLQYIDKNQTQLWQQMNTIANMR